MFTKNIIYTCSLIIVLSWCYDAYDTIVNDTGEHAPLFMRAIPVIPALLGLFYNKYYASMLKNGLFIILAFIQVMLATSKHWADDPLQPGILFIMIGIPLTVILIMLLLSDRKNFDS